MQQSEVMPCALTLIEPPTENVEYDCIVRGERPYWLR